MEILNVLPPGYHENSPRTRRREGDQLMCIECLDTFQVGMGFYHCSTCMEDCHYNCEQKGIIFN